MWRLRAATSATHRQIPKTAIFRTDCEVYGFHHGHDRVHYILRDEEQRQHSQNSEEKSDRCKLIALEFGAYRGLMNHYHYFPVIEIELDGGRRDFRRFVIFLWLFDYTNSGRFLRVDFAGDQNIWHIHCVVIISESVDHGRNVIGQCRSVVHDSIHPRFNWRKLIVNLLKKIILYKTAFLCFREWHTRLVMVYGDSGHRH